MGKKQFNSDFDKFFGKASTASSTAREETATVVAEEKEVQGKKSTDSKVSTVTPVKSFQNNLHDFLQNTFEEAFQEQLEARKNPKPEGDIPLSKKGKPMGGLDSLIRSTVDPNSIRITHTRTAEGGNVRRISLAFKERQIEKLRKIANLKRTMLKDIIYQVVEEFINDFEDKNDNNH